MSDDGKRPRARSRYMCAAAASEPGDEIAGGWSRKDLLRMNADFIAAVERAIALGLERAQDGERPVPAA